jgi:hypothetical protein
MQKRRSKILKTQGLEIAFGVVLLLIGFFLGLFTNYRLDFRFQFRPTVDAAAVLSILCTVVLAWIVGIIWNRQQYAENTSKEVLIKRLEELQVFISELAEAADGDSFYWTDATSAIKRIRTSVLSVCGHVEDIQLTLESHIRRDVETRIEKLDDLMTNTPAYRPADKIHPVTVEANKITFSKERKLEIAVAFDELRHAITSLELAINRG